MDLLQKKCRIFVSTVSRLCHTSVPKSRFNKAIRTILRFKVLTMLLFIFLAVTIQKTSSQQCFDDGNEFCIDQNDILSIDLLPGSFIFKQPESESMKNTSSFFENQHGLGTMATALHEMDYHRQRMNEYLCRGYMAEEIFKEVGSHRPKRRNDLSSNNAVSEFLEDDNITIHDKLLSDEGSTKYKDWLHRTTTLDDVYRHYVPQNTKITKKKVTQTKFDDFDGEVTGYAMQAPISNGKVSMYYDTSNEDHSYPLSMGHNNHQYASKGQVRYGPPPQPQPSFPVIHEEHYYIPDERPNKLSKGKGQDLSIKDFFEIALTALAFLAFGLFIIQLLMSITNAKTMTAMPMVTDAEGTRFKRNIFESMPLSYTGNEQLNELSHRVLRSIEAAMVAQQDSGNCLRRILCEDNKYSKENKDGRRIWLPVWSLGMSWLSGRLLNKTPWSATLDSIKASILGLGGADCEFLYPECDLEKQRRKRRRRRK